MHHIDRAQNPRRLRSGTERVGVFLAIIAALIAPWTVARTDTVAAQTIATANLAASGTATQSSTGYGGVAERAIDGNVDGNHRNSSVSHTRRETNPWWQVELAQAAPISTVTVWNRTDCCASRLSNFWVFASETPFTSDDLDTLRNDPNVTSRQVTTPPSPNTTIDFNQTNARYIRVQLQGTNFLSLAEVQINNTTSPDYPVATQSSTGYGGVAERAIDGNVDGDFGNSSVTSTAENDRAPWLNIELSGQDMIRQVILWHRTDCCTSRTDQVMIKASTTATNACLDNGAYSGIIRRNGRRANQQTVANLFRVGTPYEGLPLKSVCFTTADQGPLSIAEVQFRYGTTNTEGDDTNIGYPDDMFVGWAGIRAGYAGNDTMDLWAHRYGAATYEDAVENWNVRPDGPQGNQIHQRHAYTFAGDDVVNMGFPVFVDSDTVRLGHHVYGWEGNDKFNFVGIDNVADGIWVFGRIDDFDPAEDTIQIEGQDLNLNDLPGNVRVVSYNGPNAQDFDREQQWILISNANGGHIFYALESARTQYGSYPNYVEQHFIRSIPDISQLQDVEFESTVPYVPVSERRGLTPADRINTGTRGRFYLGSNDDELFNGDPRGGNGSVEHVFAGGGDDLIGTGASEDNLFGQDGNDKLWAGTEYDLVDGGDGADYVNGGHGDDKVYGGVGDDQVVGGRGDDTLYGDAGDASRTVWQFNGAVLVPDDSGQPLSGGELAVDLAQSVTIVDDDTALNDADNTEQQMLISSLRSARYSKVSVTGIVPVTNTRTGAQANAYQLRIDRRLDARDPADEVAYAYVFDVAGFVTAGDSIAAQGGLQAVTSLDYSAIGSIISQGGGSQGVDTFIFGTGDGDDSIADFEVGKDKLQLPTTAQGNVAVTGDASGTVLTFGDSTVTLANVDVADFLLSDIAYAD